MAQPDGWPSSFSITLPTVGTKTLTWSDGGPPFGGYQLFQPPIILALNYHPGSPWTFIVDRFLEGSVSFLITQTGILSFSTYQVTSSSGVAQASIVGSWVFGTYFTGTYDGGTSGTLAASSPTITGIDPATGTTADAALAFTITGTNLDAGGLSIVIADVLATGVVAAEGGESATGVIDLTGVTPGTHSVQVFTFDGSDTLSDSFAVTEADEPTGRVFTRRVYSDRVYTDRVYSSHVYGPAMAQ